MLLKKIDRAEKFLTENQRLLTCPHCQEAFLPIVGYHLSCTKGHQFDLSKKGTLYFLKHSIETEYNQEMLVHRQKMIATGMYDQLLTVINQQINLSDQEIVVDVGCGEGSFLQRLSDGGLGGRKIGFDISKEGVQLATEHPVEAFWCVADITHLPFGNKSIDYLLNIFSPSHYQEFTRVLKEDGKLLKIVPESGYLQELRQLFYSDQAEKQVYSNQKVVEKFDTEVKLISQTRVTYQFPVPRERQADLLKMSPLHWGASSEARKQAEATVLDVITIDVLFLIGEKKNAFI